MFQCAFVPACYKSGSASRRSRNEGVERASGADCARVGYNPMVTLLRWFDLQIGERYYIFPFGNV